MLMKCECGHTAMIERRYKDHEYRHCRSCNLKYLTHEVKNVVIIDKKWVPNKYYNFKKGE